jgi:hypothetical protein
MLASTGTPCTFRLVPRGSWYLALTGETKRNFLVDGILNTEYYGRKEREKEEGFISQLFDPGVTRWGNRWGNWRHATAVVKGNVTDSTWVHEEQLRNTVYRMPVKYLWVLPFTNKPDPERGFYRVQ